MAKATSSVGAFSAHFNRKGRFVYSTEKSREKFYTTIYVMSGYVAFLWIQTFRLWMYQGGERNVHFHAAYGFSCALFLILGLLFTLLVNHDNAIGVSNHILQYFPYFQSKS